MAPDVGLKNPVESIFDILVVRWRFRADEEAAAYQEGRNGAGGVPPNAYPLCVQVPCDKK